MNSHVIEKRKFHHEIMHSSREICDLLSDKSTLLVKNNIFLRDQVQKYILAIPDSKIQNSIVKPMILDAVFRSEMLSGGSGILCLSMIAEFIDEYFKKINMGISLRDVDREIENRIDDICKKISLSSRKFKRHDIDRIIKYTFDLDIQKEIAEAIIEKGGVFSHISLDRSSKNKTSLYFSSGFKFKISPDIEFLSGKKSWERSNVKCMVIDGFIESISEIHHLLEKISSENSSCVIFVRHLSDDVRSTLLLNFKRGTLDLMPIEVGFDENTLNILNDISICCDTDMISSLKGDTISGACRKEIPSIDKIIIAKSYTKIINEPSQATINSQIKFLKQKINDHKEPEITGLLKDRVSSLSSEDVKLSIGHDLLSRDRHSVEKFDKFFREIRELIKYGVIYSESLSSSDVERFLIDGYPYSSSSIYFSIKNAFSMIRSAISIEKAIIMK